MKNLAPHPMPSPSPEASQVDVLPEVDAGSYEVLRPDSYHTDSKSQEELLERYVGLLVPLAEKMAGKDNQPGFDKVVFLDKSARPLALMLRKFWPHIAPQTRNDEGELVTAPKPDMLFANVDRLTWRKNPTKEFDDGGMKTISDGDVEGLRNIYNVDKEHNLDDKRVLIVDEQSETGDTLRIAQELFKQAFPTSEIEGTAWINHPYMVNATGGRESQVKEIPMWYPPKDYHGLHDETGRGVFNPVSYDKDAPVHGPRFIPESYQFLSTPTYRKARYSGTTKGERLERERLKLKAERGDEHAARELESKKGDPKSLQLRREIGQMLLDFEAGKLHPPILSKREEVLGKSWLDYNRKAKVVRDLRPKY